MAADGAGPIIAFPSGGPDGSRLKAGSSLNSRFMRNGLVTLVLIVGTAALLYLFLFNEEPSQTIPYSGSEDAFLTAVADGRSIPSSCVARSSEYDAQGEG